MSYFYFFFKRTPEERTASNTLKRRNVGGQRAVMCGHWRCSTLVSPGDNVGFTSRAQTEGCGERTELSHWNMLALYLQPLEQIKRQINCTPEWGQRQAGGQRHISATLRWTESMQLKNKKTAVYCTDRVEVFQEGNKNFFFHCKYFLRPSHPSGFPNYWDGAL